MKFMINENVLIQMEIELDENRKRMYKIITFFRHTHKVHESKRYRSYENAKKLYENMIKIEYAV